MNPARTFIALAIAVLIAGAIIYSLSGESSRAPSSASVNGEVVIVTVTKDSAADVQLVQPPANQVLVPQQTDSSQTASAAAGPSAPASDAGPSITRQESSPAREAAVPNTPSEGSTGNAAAQGGSLPAPEQKPPTDNATPATAQNSSAGNPAQVGTPTSQQATRICTPATPECRGTLSVSVGNGAGDPIVLGQAGAHSASAPICTTPRAEFRTSADGSWSYSLNAGCVVKDVTVAP